MPLLRWLLVCVGLAARTAPRSPRTPTGDQNVDGFRAVMKPVVAGRHGGNAAKAAACSSERALDAEPPRKQLHSGRAELFELFGGATGTERPMQMRWHRVLQTESLLPFEEFSAAMRF